MMTAIRERIRESLAAFAGVYRNRDLRRVELAYAGSEIGAWMSSVALAVLAFGDGGATGAGVVLFLRMLPPALAAPFMGLLADRYPRRLVMVSSDVVRAALMAACAAVLVVEAPLPIVYALVALVSIVSTAFRPAQAAILPALASSPDELTAANVSSSTIASVAAFAGPALGGVVLAATSGSVCFSVSAGTFLFSALLLAGVRERVAEQDEKPAERPRFVRQLTAGMKALGSDRRVTLLFGLLGAQVLVAGILFVALTPLAFDVLRIGEDGFGNLIAALGVGGLVGAAFALGLIGRRLSTSFSLGVVLWGAPIALLALTDHEVLALGLIGVIGLANTVVDVSGFTLLQRAVPHDVLARVFALLESLFYGTTALGAILAPVLIDAFGLDATLVITGVFLPALAAISWKALRELDARGEPLQEPLALLQQVPFLAPLAPAVLETLASHAVPVEVKAGEQIFWQGDEGDRFYVIRNGRISITVDGQEAPELATGDYFGEIALVRDVPRTATATARTDSSLCALDRDEFVAAVTGHAPSAEAADAVVATRLGALRPVATL
jgi:MFS family permease